MDILVRFGDGTTEMRDAESPCLLAPFDPPRKHPSEERWYLYFPDEARPLSFCALTVRELDGAARGREDVYVWRLTGHTEEPYTLTGEWARAKVETVEEQIERLTRERDEAQKCIASLRAWAENASHWTAVARGNAWGELRSLIDGKGD